MSFFIPKYSAVRYGRPHLAGWRLHAAWLVLVPVCAGGCSWVPNALGMLNRHLVQAQDVLALPGEKVVLRVRLESGSFLRDERNHAVQFFLDGQIHSVTVTDREGFAETVFVPPAPGDYLFQIETPSKTFTDSWPDTNLLVSCQRADAPLAVIDLDGTLMAPDFDKVLKGDPEPLPQALAVLTRLAQDYTIIYLTHRPEFFGPKSKDWLARHGFPRGPVLLSARYSFNQGSQRYKTERLQDLRSRFTGMTVGIGDQISDALAYRENGLQAILVYQVSDPDEADDVRKQALRLGELPEEVQIVHDWAEVQAALWEGGQFPPSRRKAELLQQAAQPQPKWKLW